MESDKIRRGPSLSYIYIYIYRGDSPHFFFVLAEYSVQLYYTRRFRGLYTFPLSLSLAPRNRYICVRAGRHRRARIVYAHTHVYVCIYRTAYIMYNGTSSALGGARSCALNAPSSSSSSGATCAIPFFGFAHTHTHTCIHHVLYLYMCL